MIEIRILEPEPPDPHDHEHPDNARNLKRIVGLLDSTPACASCGEVATLVAGPAAEWVIDHRHKLGCPEGAEPEAYEVYVGDGYDAGAHREAEVIWSASSGAEHDNAP